MSGVTEAYWSMLFPRFPSATVGIVRVILANAGEAAIADKEPVLRGIVPNAVEDRRR